MDRPTKIKVGALDYEVRWLGQDWQRSADTFAQCDNALQIITIYADAPPSIIPCCFAHEVVHALLYLMRIQGDSNSEEIVANAAGYLLTGFWRDNPEAFEWWSGLVR